MSAIQTVVNNSKQIARRVSELLTPLRKIAQRASPHVEDIVKGDYNPTTGRKCQDCFRDHKSPTSPTVHLALSLTIQDLLETTQLSDYCFRIMSVTAVYLAVVAQIEQQTVDPGSTIVSQTVKPKLISPGLWA